MKKLLLLIFCMGLSHICHSAEYKYLPLTLQKILVNDNLHDYIDEWNPRKRVPMVLPSVGYNDSGVFIQCSYPLYDVEVHIKDESGNCLFDTIVVNVFSAVVGIGRNSPTPINMSMSGTVSLEGEASTAGSFPSMPISFWIPGANIPQSAVGYIPLYNKPLGVVNFTGRPVFPITYHKTSRLYNDDSLPGDGLVHEIYEAASIHTYGDFSNYLIINPEVEKIADVEIVSQEILKKKGDDYRPGLVQVYENISYNNPYIAYQGKKEIVDMDFIVRFVIKVTPKDGGDVSYLIKTLDLKEVWDYK